MSKKVIHGDKPVRADRAIDHEFGKWRAGDVRRKALAEQISLTERRNFVRDQIIEDASQGDIDDD